MDHGREAHPWNRSPAHWAFLLPLHAQLSIHTAPWYVRYGIRGKFQSDPPFPSDDEGNQIQLQHGESESQ